MVGALRRCGRTERALANKCVGREALCAQVRRAGRFLLSQQNRDPISPTCGCLDRRFWAWKLVDFPEATFQRNVYPLAWLLRQSSNAEEQECLGHAVRVGLKYAFKIQHRNGSFDQAFPHEYSFGATAFLLESLLRAYQIVCDRLPPEERVVIEGGLRRAAGFLCDHDETHGHIANHLAGAAVALALSASTFKDNRHARRSEELLARVIGKQSPEGWFLEYNGADPGYQTLCLYYLASYQRLRPSPDLKEALDRAVAFLSWFIHPDGSFGGEYGSRRTAIFYPGGLALLSAHNPIARGMLARTFQAIVDGRAVTLDDVDVGNYAALLSNYLVAIEQTPTVLKADEPLPWETNGSQDFQQAGLFVRSTPSYYAVFGANNGGVLKVFDRRSGRQLCNDGGYVGQLENGTRITTQVTKTPPECAIQLGNIVVTAPFYVLREPVPSPFLFLLLRILNLTLMRSVFLGNLVKNRLAQALILGANRVPLDLVRRVHFHSDRVIVEDQIRWHKRAAIRWLAYGVPFVSIHMASARYFDGSDVPVKDNRRTVDLAAVRAGQIVRSEFFPCNEA